MLPIVEIIQVLNKEYKIEKNKEGSNNTDKIVIMYKT